MNHGDVLLEISWGTGVSENVVYPPSQVACSLLKKFDKIINQCSFWYPIFRETNISNNNHGDFTCLRVSKGI